MDMRILQEFLKWSTILNGSILIFSTLLLLVASDFIYSVHGQLFHLPREDFNVVIYSVLGLYKILILTFNLVPYVVLRIIKK